MSWQSDKAWSGKFIPELKRICGEYLVGEAPQEEDALRNSDLIVLTLAPVRVACRIRKFAYVKRYPDEFTIRAGRPNGTKTELAKVIEGWGDYILYGFADETETGLCAWTLGNLGVFRLWFMRGLTRLEAGLMPGDEQFNGDGSSSFRAFRIAELPAEFVVARKQYAPAVALGVALWP